jgi:hypothetical protein
MRQRGAVRIVPRSPITVAVQEGGVPVAYGVVANISEAGACIWTDAGLLAGSPVNLRLSFPRESQPDDAEGVVVWGDPGSGTRRYGLRWTDPSGARQARLSRVDAFSPSSPDEDPRGTG